MAAHPIPLQADTARMPVRPVLLTCFTARMLAPYDTGALQLTARGGNLRLPIVWGLLTHLAV